MKLNDGILTSFDALRGKEYTVPEYDVRTMRALTRERPQWAHFGPGNIFRAHVARAHQELLNAGLSETGIVAFAGRGSETPGSAYAPFDNLSLCVLLKADGTMDKHLVASVAEAHALEGAGLSRAIEVFEAASLQIATFTITEKGYARMSYERDLRKPLAEAESLMGQVAYLLSRRMAACVGPVSLVSMDNCSQNGDKLKAAILELAADDPALVNYIENEVAFPWTMIDKITPRPDARVLAVLEADGFEGIAPVVTPRGTHVAPFVNAEEKEYLVIEEAFPAGRPPLERAGMYFAARETVSKVERMKVTVCLNPLHTALAVFGCLLGYDAIWKETEDAELSRLIRVIGYGEGLPVSPDPGIISPKSFLDEVVNDRFPNPFLPDTPQRIATDTSQKVAIRFGETIKAHAARGDAGRLVGIPLALAGWLRYLDATDDAGNCMKLSDDPRLHELTSRTAADILRDASVFGVDLYDAGLAEKVLGYLGRMREGKGAVRRTLKVALQMSGENGHDAGSGAS